MELEERYFLDGNFTVHTGKWQDKHRLPPKPMESLSENDLFPFETWEKLTEGVQIKDKDILYMMYCDLPQSKLLEKYPNIQITKDINKATKVLVSHNLLKRIYNFDINVEYQSKNYPAGGDNYIWREIPMGKIRQESQYIANSSIFKIDSLYNGNVYVKDVWVAGNKSRYEKYPLVKLKPFKAYHTCYDGSQKQISYIKLLDSIKDKLPIIFDKDILVESNTEMVIIDENIYKSLCDMFKSVDKNSHKLAIDIIGNSNIELSKIFILLLANDFARQISGSKGNRNNENFRSVTKCLGLSKVTKMKWYGWAKFISKNHRLNENEKIILNKYCLDCLNKDMAKVEITVNSATMDFLGL